MKRHVFLLIVLAHASTASAQPASKVYTRPNVPSKDALDRLNLKLAWRVVIPVDGTKDGIFSAQVVGDQFFVQTRSGTVAALAMADGSTLWRAQVGKPYCTMQPIAWNGESVFVSRGSSMHAFDRKTGRQQWELSLPSNPSAAPAADDDQLVVVMTPDRIHVFSLPHPSKKVQDSPDILAQRALYQGLTNRVPDIRQPGDYQNQRLPVPGVDPELMWHTRKDIHIEQTPILFGDTVAFAGTDGTFIATSTHSPRTIHTFKAEAGLFAPMGQHSKIVGEGPSARRLDVVYVASKDMNLYAIDVDRGETLWRVTGGAPIFRKVEVTDDDVYITPEKRGLVRVKRENGEVLWFNRDARQFLSVGRNFVHALDDKGALILIDKQKGTVRGRLDVKDFLVPISNEWTDRFFLAANDGTLLCLHDRDQKNPLVNRVPFTLPQAKPKEGEKPPMGEEMPKEGEKEKEKEKEEDK